MEIVKVRPKCQVEGCTRNAQLTTSLKEWKFRKSNWVRERYNVEEGHVCQWHHDEYIALELNGATSKTAFKNSRHPYLQYRKGFCENQDGRFGFKCTFTAPPSYVLEELGLNTDFQGWLQVDHKNGNHLDNREENLQTLCVNCHNVKTFANGDYATPGRKTRAKPAPLALAA